MSLRREHILVFGELALVDEPTAYELQTFHVYPAGLTERRQAEIAAWIDQVRSQLTANDRRFLRALHIADGDGAA